MFHRSLLFYPALLAALFLMSCYGNQTETRHGTLPTHPAVPIRPELQTNVTLPVRAAFYYPWYPETWTVNGAKVATVPTLGFYTSGDPGVIAAHVEALEYAHIGVAILSWWGEGTHDEAARVPELFRQTRALGAPLKWAVYYEKEGTGDPSVAELQADLKYLYRYLGPDYAVVDGKPVIFVYNADDTDCRVADRWRAAAPEWYVVLKVFPDYRSCVSQPSSWHQYAPARATDHQAGYSSSVSPGFWRADEPSPRLPRDLARWQHDVQAMTAAGEPWQLITTFNEWGEGTAVESAAAWVGGRFGAYLKVLAETAP